MMTGQSGTGATRRKGTGFPKAIYLPRMIGLGSLSLGIGAALLQRHAGWWLYALLVAFGAVWPQVACAWAVRSEKPVAAEYINLRLDALFCGFWAAAMGFNAVPTLLMGTVLLMDNTTVGGLRLLWHTIGAAAFGICAGLLITGTQTCLISAMYVRVASLPFLLFYPVVIGVLMYRNSMRVQAEKSKLRERTERDGLSGLYSRDFWESRLAERFELCRREGRPAALVVFDIDHFKEINDQYGHLRGDETIRELGQAVLAQLRGGEIAARIGGDEFGILLPGDDGSGAAAMVARIQAALAERRFAHDGVSYALTMSFGVAALAPEMASPRDWMHGADEALYAAKRGGRNKLEIFDTTKKTSS